MLRHAPEKALPEGALYRNKKKTKLSYKDARKQQNEKLERN